MRISFGNDHAGFRMRADVLQILSKMGCEVVDCGSNGEQQVDFPDIAWDVCDAVRKGKVDRGIMVCGTGIGAVIAANKVAGIRAALCHDYHSAHQCVEHDNVNVMCLGAQIIGPWLVEDIIDAFLNAKFSESEEQFKRRVEKLRNLELTMSRELHGASLD